MNIAEAKKQEAKIAEMLNEIKADIIRKVETAKPIAGVKPINGQVSCCSVNIGALGNSLNLDPAFYMQGSQAKAVKKHISHAHTITELVDRLNTLMEDGKVRMDGNYYVVLNESTMSVIRDFFKTEGINP